MTRPPTSRTVSAVAIVASSSASGLLADEAPQYTPVGDGRFVPANQAALDECAAWNNFADRWNTYTATRSAP